MNPAVEVTLVLAGSAGFLAGWAVYKFRRPAGGGTPPLARYVRSHDPGGSGDWIEHLDGVDWFDAPVPPHRHTCWPQTRGCLGGELVYRCACGAHQYADLGVWIERNTRTPRTPAEQATRERNREWDRLYEQFGRAMEDHDTGRMNTIRERMRVLFEEGIS